MLTKEEGLRELAQQYTRPKVHSFLLHATFDKN
jgi:hypothetical protein